MVPSLSKKKQDIKETSPSPSLKRHGPGSTQGNRSKVSRCSSRVGDSSKGGARKAKRHAKNSVGEEVSEGSDGTSAKRRLRRSPHVAKKARKQPDNLRKCNGTIAPTKIRILRRNTVSTLRIRTVHHQIVVPVHLLPIPNCSKVAFMFVMPKKSRMR